MPRKAPRPTFGLLAATVVALILLMLPATALAQGYGPIADVWPSCNFGCTAKDVDLTEYFLAGDANCTPLATGSCSAGDPVDVFICATFHSNANSDRTAIILLAKGVEVPLEGDPITLFDFYGTDGNISPYAGYCSPDLITPGGDWTGIIYQPPSGFQWTCGDELQVNDSILSWETSSGSGITCSNVVPDCSSRGTSQCRKWDSLIVRAPLVARFIYGPTCAGAEVQFTDKTTGGASPYTYEWWFDWDGTGDPPPVDSTEQNPVHTYTTPGTYDVTLRVTDSAQATNTETQLAIVVHSNPTAGISYMSDDPPVNWRYVFADASTAATGDYACDDPNADITTWAWDFDDGQTSDVQDPLAVDFTHPLAGKPPYDVSLKVTDACSCSDEAMEPVTFGPNAVAQRSFQAVTEFAPAVPLAAALLTAGLVAAGGVVLRKKRR
jgi:PKD repeat protein